MVKKDENVTEFDRMMFDVSQDCAKRGIDFNNLSFEQKNKEFRKWHINENYKKKLEKMSEEERLMEVFFTK